MHEMIDTTTQASLRDGGPVLLRLMDRADLARVRSLLDTVPASDRPAEPTPSGDPRAAVTLVVSRGEQILGYASYVACAPTVARMSMVVAPGFQGLGVGTLLLTELSARGDAAGITRFTTETSANNIGLLHLLCHSGFPVTCRSRPGRVAVDQGTRLPEPGRQQAQHREDVATAVGIAHVLRPTSVAVIGASRDRQSPGGALLHNMVAGGFTGSVYPVNPAGGIIEGLPAHRSITDVPGEVELAIVAVPAAIVPTVAGQCAARGVQALVVISAGFAETGPEGAALQEQLLTVCREAGMRLVGPNCMGVLNTDPRVRLHAIFAGDVPAAGRVALVSQSGGLGLAAMSLADELAIGLSTFVSIGNRADVSANDILQYLETDSGTDVVLLYLESFGNPRNFARIARAVSATTPIVAVKAGRSVAGAAATASHTGALVAASDATIDALFHQAGIIRTDTLEELLDAGTLLAHFPLPAGPRVAVIANAGGLGVLAVDACDHAGLIAPELSAGLRARLAEIRPQAATRNPIDTLPGADAQDLERLVRVVADSGEVDAIVGVWVLPGDDPDDPATRLVELAWEAPGGLPVVPVLVGESSAGRGIAVFGAPERAIHALGRAWWQRHWRQTDQGRVPVLEGIDTAAAAAVVERVAAAGGGWLSMPDVDALLRCYGIPTLEVRAVATPEAAAAAADELGGPVALKALGPTLLHKSDAGAVELDLPGGGAVRTAAGRLLAHLAERGHPVDSLLVQRMGPKGVELLAGVVHDPTFGPVLACGAGGTVTELLHDVAIRLTPLTDLDASRMLRELRTFPLLDGYRGATPCDVSAVEDVLLRLSHLADEHPLLAEIDANPLTATSDGAVVVDARVRVTAPR